MADSQGLLHQRVLDAAARFPERIAVIDAAVGTQARRPRDCASAVRPHAWTYAELVTQARRVAGALPVAPSGGRNPLVALLGDKTCWSIAAILGTLCAGYGYVPIVGLETASAIDAALDCTRPEALLTTALPPVLRNAVCEVAFAPGALLDLQGDLPADAFRGQQRLHLGRVAEPRAVPRGSIAYVVFTSGSTGRPKGAAVSHRAAAAAVAMFEEHLQPHPSDRVCGQVALGFDVSVFDIFATLGSGATLVLLSIDDSERRDPIGHFRNAMVEHRISSLFTVPSVARAVFGEASPAIGTSSLRRLLLTGEPLDVGLARTLLGQLPPDAALWNLYGASEFPYVLARQVKRDDAAPPNAFDRLGRGVCLTLARAGQSDDEATADTGLASRPEPPGDGTGRPAELLVGGPAIFAGYLESGRRIGAPGPTGVRTGDLVIRGRDDAWHLLGRVDRTVKIAGVRADLDAIEAHLQTHPDVRAAAVVLAPGGAEAVAFVASSVVDEALLGASLDRHCRNLLSPWVCPARYRVIAQLPRTASGKKDRLRLLELCG